MTGATPSNLPPQYLEKETQSFTCDSLEMFIFLPSSTLWGLTKQHCGRTPVICFWPAPKPSGQCWTSHMHSCRPPTGKGRERMAGHWARPSQTSMHLPTLFSHSGAPSFNINLEDYLSSIYYLKRWEYQTTWPASWEICMQIKKQQAELDMEQQTGSKQERSTSRLYTVTLLI